MSRSRRVYHPDAREGTELELSEDEAHHVTRVLRLRAGDRVSVFDGLGGEWEATLLSSGPDPARVRIGRACSGVVEAPLAVTIYQGLGRLDRMDWLVQKATETGVRAIRLVTMHRSDSSRGARGRVGRWQRIALEACKQSGRRVIPEICIDDDLPGSPETGTSPWVLDPREEAVPISEVLAGNAPSGGVAIVVGPEGGLTPAETAGLVERGWRRVHLGPRVLRTETAGVVASALALHVWGDLGRI
ncbi:MAG: 16S rRNA (uracil(1498)-N(3))-methyltransferase [Acidobacteriota bacterium]|nr:16S rRNA (uracil(1498)-N(3))-methyltransferase [Acidobacteriota bacterium]